MVKSIEQYISETTKSYDPAIKAYNQQLSGLSGQTEASIKDIENQFANQRSQLLNSANQAAEAASLSAAGNGGSFGGATNEANRKYYQQSFVPAMTSSNTNRSSAIAQARANEASRRSNLEQQLANLYTQANTYGTQRYDDALKQEEAIRQFNEQQALARQQMELAEKARQEQLAENKRQFDLQLEESRKQAAAARAASQAASNSWMDYYNKAISSANQNQASNNITGRRTVMYGAVPVQQVQVNGQWVNATDYAKTAANTAKSTINSILGKLKR